MKFSLEKAVRQNILALTPYRCARDDYSSGILLDANENSFGPATTSSFHFNELERYPDPHQHTAKTLLCKLRGLPDPSYFFTGVGSDESIDLIIRIFCTPAMENILICPPTYGMYSVCAQVNDVGVVKVPLITDDASYQLDVPEINKVLSQDPTIKVVFLCSPGNPTGTLLTLDSIKSVLENTSYTGVVVVDEAYIDFSVDVNNKTGRCSISEWVLKYPNLIVIQTLSKSFGLAGIRFGIAISTPEIIAIFNKTKAPYNISTPTSEIAISALEPDGIAKMNANVDAIIQERANLIKSLKQLEGIGNIRGANDANFVLVEILDKQTRQPSNDVAFALYKQLAESNGIVVRFRGSELGCTGCLRITIGTPAENSTLVSKISALL